MNASPEPGAIVGGAGLPGALRILIADDHALFRRGLQLVLTDIFPGVGICEAKDVEEVLACLRREPRPDLVLLDLAMPGMTGAGGDRFAGLPRITKTAPGVIVVILSAHSQPEEIARAMELGVRGYVPKGSSESVLKHAISLVVAGEVYVPPSVLGMVRHVRRAAARETAGTVATASSLIDQLTPRQRDTLELIMLGQSNKEIARNLDLLESTVKAHVRVILQKLRAGNRTQAARIALDLGLRPPASRHE